MKNFVLNPPPQAGDKYSAVFVSPESIANFAMSREAITNAITVSDKLSPDPYTEYVSEYYKKGLALCDHHWRFMDIVTTLYATAKLGQPKNYLEIGVRRGRSTCAVVHGCKYTNIYAFDIWQENYAGNENPGVEFVRNELKKFDHQGEASYFSGDSRKTIPAFLKENPDIKFDLITVDGDHSLDGAWTDLVNVSSSLSVGGVIVFDDTNNPYCPGLNQLWNDFLIADGGLDGYTFNSLGAGVALAIRVKSPLKINMPRKKKWFPLRAS